MSPEQKELITDLASLLETNREDVSDETIDALNLVTSLACYVERSVHYRLRGSMRVAEEPERHLEETCRRLRGLGITW